MIIIEKFLGKRVEIPEDRRYYPKQGIWAQKVDPFVVFGLTQPALVLYGGFKDADWLVDSDRPVSAGEAALFAITGKILYLDAPMAGIISFNEAIREDPARVQSDAYGEGWLFRIEPAADGDDQYRSLASAQEYLASLQGSDGLKNPEGIKGGVSGICKAVYTGINQQKI
jgi:glycine cleavage system H protein